MSYAAGAGWHGSSPAADAQARARRRRRPAARTPARALFGRQGDWSRTSSDGERKASETRELGWGRRAVGRVRDRGARQGRREHSYRSGDTDATEDEALAPRDRALPVATSVS